jgi:hypothetical protein
MSQNQGAGAVVEVGVSIQSNTLIVGVNGGNVKAKAGDKIVWRAGPGVKAFTLQFFRLAAEPHARHDHDRPPIVVADLPRWPFAEPEPKGGVVGPTQEFVGTLAGHAGPAVGFKYTVAVGNLQLDPIVIFD